MTIPAIPPRKPDMAKGGQPILLIKTPPRDHKEPAKTSRRIALFLFIVKK